MIQKLIIAVLLIVSFSTLAIAQDDPVPMEGPILDRFVERLEKRQADVDRDVQAMEARLAIFERLQKRFEASEETNRAEVGRLRDRIAEAMAERQKSRVELAQIRAQAAKDKRAHQLEMKKQQIELKKLRAEQGTFFDRLAKYQNERPTLAGRIIWLCVAAVCCLFTTVLALRFFK